MKHFALLAAVAFLPTLTMAEPAKEAEKPTPAAESKTPKVRLKTSKGDIVLELNAEKAPITVANFLSYVSKKHYDGTVFHRVIDGFMIQGGGFEQKDGTLAEKTTGSGIKNEGQNGLSNATGTIAMARTNDPDSATAQFFINVSDNAMLDYPNNGGYAVFGKVIEGMDVVEKIKKSATGSAPLNMINKANGTRVTMTTGDVPAEAIVITSANVE